MSCIPTYSIEITRSQNTSDEASAANRLDLKNAANFATVGRRKPFLPGDGVP